MTPNLEREFITIKTLFQTSETFLFLQRQQRIDKVLAQTNFNYELNYNYRYCFISLHLPLLTFSTHPPPHPHPLNDSVNDDTLS